MYVHHFYIDKWPIQGMVSITESSFLGVCSSFFTRINALGSGLSIVSLARQVMTKENFP